MHWLPSLNRCCTHTIQRMSISSANLWGWVGVVRVSERPTTLSIHVPSLTHLRVIENYGSTGFRKVKQNKHHQKIAPKRSKARVSWRASLILLDSTAALSCTPISVMTSGAPGHLQRWPGQHHLCAPIKPATSTNQADCPSRTTNPAARLGPVSAVSAPAQSAKTVLGDLNHRELCTMATSLDWRRTTACSW